MDAQILFAIGKAYDDYIAEREFIPLLDSFFQAIDGYINSPNNENLQQISVSADGVISALDVQLTDRMPRTWISIAENVGVVRLSGHALRDRIQTLLRENQVTLDFVRSEIKEIRRQVSGLTDSFKTLNSALSSLDIPIYTLDGEEGEVSYFIPKDVTELSLGDFAGECKELRFIYRVISELETGQVEEPTIRKISTSDPLIVVAATYAVVRGVLKVTDQILELYKKVHEIRLIKAQADRAELEVISVAAETQIRSEIEVGISEIVNSLVQDRKRPGGGGRTDEEIREFVQRAVEQLAARLDNGYRIEADVSPQTRALKTGPDVTPDEAQDFRESIEGVQKRIRYLEFEGVPILNLPPPANDEQ